MTKTNGARTTSHRALTVADVMNRAVVSAYRGALFKEIARALARNDIDTVPVVDEEHRVIGVVTASDLLARLAPPRLTPRGHRLTGPLESQRKRHAACARDLMTHPAVTTTPETTIAEAARRAARFRVRSLPVVDERGTLVGMITRSDLVKVFLRSDEEIRSAVEHEAVPAATRRGRDAVEVQVEEGVVTMTGRVHDRLTARDLVHNTERVPGVVGVRTDLDIDGDDTLVPLPR